MKKNLLLVVLLMAVAALAIAVARQNQQITQMKEELASASVEKAKTAPVPAPKKELSEPLPKASPVEPVPTAPPSLVPAPNAPVSTGGAVSNYFSSLAGMMKDPQVKEMMRVQQKMALAKMYGSLSKYLDLPATKQDALKELLADRQMAMAEAGLSMMSGSESERKRATEEVKALKADYDKKIQDLLGPQDYEVFQDYEKTVGERVQLQMFKDALPADAALTEQQEDDLITAMYEERKALPPSSLMNNQTPDPSQMTEERIAETLKQIEQLQQRYADRAAAILNPAQLEQFTKWQQQFSTMQAAGLKMAAQVFGKKGAQSSPFTSPGSTP